MRSADKIVALIYAASQKRMHPELLTPKQLGPIYWDIQDYHPDVAFPISGTSVDTDEQTSLSIVTPIYKKGVLKKLLDIPLLGRTNYLTYRLHLVPVLQAILGNDSGKAYIRPRFSHIAVKESQRTYILMNHQDVCCMSGTVDLKDL